IKRNYEVEGDGGGIVPVEELEFWKAARMSSAAPTYFEPFQYERKLYVDGGLSANSPVDVICREIDNSNFKIGALLSIGK
uniref:PNPLA domain-containing protein n=1 Tax=Plectus sambesii TaxID=2011161 RepID=A0A914USQ3_9BILA